tara:strand:+ start:51 stop:551 length:501 start_codon:yes stop_codon:yes gene_type:complete
MLNTVTGPTREDSMLGQKIERKLGNVIAEFGGCSVVGKKAGSFFANYNDIEDKLFKKLDSRLEMDYVIKTPSGPIFIDSKTASMTGKCYAKATIQCTAFKNKFPNCKIWFIYESLSAEYNSLKTYKESVRYLDKLINSKILDGYCKTGWEDRIVDGNTNNNINKFF